jgi:hypothetical protein
MKSTRLSKTGENGLRQPTRCFAETRLDVVAGYLRSKGKPRTLKEMSAAVEREVMRRHNSGRY